MLFRSVLDKRVLARGGTKLGRVDGIVLQLREGKAPRVMSLELGAITLAGRLSARLGKWVAGIKDKIGVGENVPVRIPFEKITSRGMDIKVGLDAEDTNALQWEEWLSDRILKHIPGSRK